MANAIISLIFIEVECFNESDIHGNIRIYFELHLIVEQQKDFTVDLIYLNCVRSM